MTDINNLVNSSTIQDLRDDYMADIVILLTGDIYSNIYGEAASVEPDANNAYAIIVAEYASAGRATFAHEVGHLFGCRHESNSDPTGMAYAHAHRFRTWFLAPWHHTIMYSGPGLGNHSRLLYFSNPNVSYDGENTGVVGSANNARRVSETFPTVLNFEPPPDRPLGGYIAGPQTGLAYHSYDFEAFAACGTPPFTYEWRTSDDGIYYGSIKSTNEIFTELLPCMSGHDGTDQYAYYYIRLKITDANLESTTVFHNIYVDNSTCVHEFDSKRNDSLIDTVLSADTLKLRGKLLNLDYFQIYPNPSTDHLKILYKVIKKTNFLIIDLYDNQGRLLKTIRDSQINMGVYKKRINIQNYSPGIYYCKITTDNGSSTKKIIIEKLILTK